MVFYTSREIVGSRLCAGNSLVKLCISTEYSVENAVLEARRVLEVDVQLTICAVVCDRDTGTNGGYEAVKDEGKTVASYQ